MLPRAPPTPHRGGFCVVAFFKWQYLMLEAKRFLVYLACTLLAHQEQAHTCLLLVQVPGLSWTFLQINFLKNIFISLSHVCACAV